MYADNQQSWQKPAVANIPPVRPLPCRAKPAAGEGWGGGSIRNFTANAIQTPLRQHTFQDTI